MAEIILFGLALLGTAACLWGCNKGFDITDEAIVLLQAQHPKDVRCYPFFDYAYLAPFHRLTRGSLPVHRALVIVLMIVSCAAFSNGVSDLIVVTIPALSQYQLELALVAYVGTLLRFVFGPRIFYYNNVNAFSLLALTGLLFSASFDPSGNSRAMLFAVGAFIGFQFFIKISSCLSTLASVLALAPMLASGGLVERLSTDLPIVGGFFAFGVLHFTIVQSPRRWWDAFSSQLKTAKLFTWGVSCIPRHLKEMKIFLNKGLREYSRPFIVASVGSLLVSVCCFSRPSLIPAAAVVALWTMVEFVEQCRRLRTWTPKIYEEQFSSVTSLVAFLLIGGILSVPLLLVPNLEQALSLDYRLWLALCFVAALPFLGAIGTGNPLFVNTVFHHAAWYMLAGMMLIGWGKALDSELLSGALLVVFAAHGIQQFLYGMIKEPYRLVGPLNAQNESVEIGFPATKVKMAPVAAAFLRLFKETLEANGFKPGDDIIALFDMPGLVYAVGGRSPGHQWYYTMASCHDAMMEANKWHLSRVSTERLQHAFVVQKGDISFFNGHLDSLQISFPHEYVVCGQMVSPFSWEVVTIWKPLVAVKSTDACSKHRHILLAKRALESGRPEDAIRSMEQAVQEQPDNSELREDLGNLLLQRGQPARAQEHFSAALRVSDRSAAAALGMALALVQTDTFSGVRPLVDTALAADGCNVLALKILGCVAAREGATDEAVRSFERALALEPEDQESLTQLIVLESEAGNVPRVRELVERLTALNPNHPNLSKLRHSIMNGYTSPVA